MGLCVDLLFFLDTAKNIIEYIEVISQILRYGGVWINLGPLLYHYSEMEGEKSIELTLEELKKVIISFGFQFEREHMIQSMYTCNQQSMMKVTYECAFFVAVKKVI